MPPRKPHKRQSRTSHVFITLACLTLGGLVVGCTVLVYVFIQLPSRHVAVPAVAGEMSITWEQPVLPQTAQPAPKVSAVSGILVDVASGSILWAKQAHDVRPLASLTKLATVGAYVATHPDLSEQYVVPATFADDGIIDVVEPGTSVSRLRIPAGTIVSYHDLLAATLIGSANNAARSLSRTIGKNDADRIHSYARSTGAQTVYIVEPTGLDPANVGSAVDAMLVAHAAFRTPVVSELASTSTYTISNRYRVTSTNQLNPQGAYNVLAAKTGYLVEAGYNFAVAVEQDGHELLLVTLGSMSSSTRFSDAHALLQWALTSVEWVPSVE